MNEFSNLWRKLAKSKKYREEFVAAQVKRGIPFQIRTLLKNSGLSQEEIASRAGITQGVLSRAANPDYGNLTLNTIIRIAAGFDVAFIGKFVPFSELGRWFVGLSEDAVRVNSFEAESAELLESHRSIESGIVTHLGVQQQPERKPQQRAAAATALGVFFQSPSPDQRPDNLGNLIFIDKPKQVVVQQPPLSASCAGALR